MNRSGRQAWSTGGCGSFTMAGRLVPRSHDPVAAPMGGRYICVRGFARLPPRAKPPSLSRSLGDGAQLVERTEDLGRVACRLDPGPDASDPPVRSDEEG